MKSKKMSSKLRYVSKEVLLSIAVIALAAAFIFVAVTLFRLDWTYEEEIVSGIVYDAKFDTPFGGNTEFKVRASADMAVTEYTSKTYCLPPKSRYEELVREAAADKDIKVVVRVKKVEVHLKDNAYTCDDNVEVTRKEQK